MTLDLQTHPGNETVTFAVRVQPRASKNQVIGVINGALKIRIQAPAVENRANEELCAYLAELLKRPKSAVRILFGQHGRNKRIQVFGVTAAEVNALISFET